MDGTEPPPSESGRRAIPAASGSGRTRQIEQRPPRPSGPVSIAPAHSLHRAAKTATPFGAAPRTSAHIVEVPSVATEPARKLVRSIAAQVNWRAAASLVSRTFPPLLTEVFLLLFVLAVVLQTTLFLTRSRLDPLQGAALWVIPAAAILLAVIITWKAVRAAYPTRAEMMNAVDRAAGWPSTLLTAWRLSQQKKLDPFSAAALTRGAVQIVDIEAHARQVFPIVAPRAFRHLPLIVGGTILALILPVGVRLGWTDAPDSFCLVPGTDGREARLEVDPGQVEFFLYSNRPVTYTTYLEGHDAGFSDPSEATIVRYQLRESGEYTFYAQAVATDGQRDPTPVVKRFVITGDPGDGPDGGEEPVAGASPIPPVIDRPTPGHTPAPLPTPTPSPSEAESSGGGGESDPQPAGGDQGDGDDGGNGEDPLELERRPTYVDLFGDGDGPSIEETLPSLVEREGGDPTEVERRFRENITKVIERSAGAVQREDVPESLRKIVREYSEELSEALKR